MPLSGSRLRDVHAVISGALGLAARYGVDAVQRCGAGAPSGTSGRKTGVETSSVHDAATRSVRPSQVTSAAFTA
jgi:hypothetical protein